MDREGADVMVTLESMKNKLYGWGKPILTQCTLLIIPRACFIKYKPFQWKRRA